MSILSALVCLVSNFVGYVEVGVVDVVNLCIAGLAAALVAIIPYLPSLPSFPSLSDSSYWAVLNWAVPLSSYAALALSLVTLFVSFYAYRIALRWIKAL